jgi:cytidylate kinase
MGCKVVCISHATGAGGEDVGRLVAERLGFGYVDGEIVARAAARGGIDPGQVADEERRKSLGARLLEAWGHGGGEAWALTGSGSLGAGDQPESEEIRALIREVTEQAAARGNVVIVAHAASHTVEPGHEALRVFVTASADTRAERLRETRALDHENAARAIGESDAGRRDYLKRFYGVDEELPTHYDLVVNTDALSIEQAARLIAEAGSA